MRMIFISIIENSLELSFTRRSGLDVRGLPCCIRSRFGYRNTTRRKARPLE